MRMRNRLKYTLTVICNQIDRFTPRLSDMIGTIYRLKYLWSIKLMFCESKSRSQRDLDLTCRVESVSHSNCVAIQKDHVIFCGAHHGFTLTESQSTLSRVSFSLYPTDAKPPGWVGERAVRGEERRAPLSKAESFSHLRVVVASSSRLDEKKDSRPEHTIYSHTQRTLSAKIWMSYRLGNFRFFITKKLSTLACKLYGPQNRSKIQIYPFNPFPCG